MGRPQSSPIDEVMTPTIRKPATRRILARRALREFWEKHPESEQPLRAWYHEARTAEWRSPLDVKRRCANASIVGKNRVVFNIKGNDYRLVAAIQYQAGVVAIHFFGTHAEYDKIDAETV